MNNRLLVIEDDDSLRFTLVDNLELEGYEVFSACNITQAKSVFEKHAKTNHPIELIILDVMLPDGSGYELSKELRLNKQNVMILMLTARTLDSDLHEGFNSGADDYLTKPYKIAELLLRVKALLRRNSTAEIMHETALINNFEINWQRRSISKEDNEIHLTKKEFDLLTLLFNKINQPLSRDEILSHVWGEQVYVEERTVDNFISNIRKALNLNKPQMYFIKTVRGIGYSLIKAKD